MADNKIKVLFVCVHNSARSQIAEAFLRQMGNDDFIVESGGIEPGTINPFVVEVMKEVGIDISQSKTKSVFDLYKQGKTFNFIISVCDKQAGEKCPVFPGNVVRYDWEFKDPSSFEGTDDEILEQTREVRDLIKEKIEEFLKKDF